MKEHSPNLGRKRAAVLAVLVIVAYLGGCAGVHFQKKTNIDLQTKLDGASTGLSIQWI
jgi:ABC-type uncharacterized transport system auxiliary subunit